MPMFKANMNALTKAGLRDEVIVMVGGAPVTQEYADVAGAEGYAADASAARAGPDTIRELFHMEPGTYLLADSRVA
jgi:methanogenic corrinoid protein MtbC1